MGKEVVKELIQNNLNTKNLKLELERILIPNQRDEILENYRQLHSLLGGEGASDRAAKIITN